MKQKILIVKSGIPVVYGGEEVKTMLAWRSTCDTSSSGTPAWTSHAAHHAALQSGA